MARYRCTVCNYIYDESKESGAWDALPDDWKCPRCGAPKSAFVRIEEEKQEGSEANRAAGAETNKTEKKRETITPSPKSSGKMPLKKRFILLHRLCGYLFVVIYVYFLIIMLPRLWSYQVEFPARTAIHFSLGMFLGALLLMKVLVLRFYRRLDGLLVNWLGMLVFATTVVVIGISTPFAFHEAAMRSAGRERDTYSAENRRRVEKLLVETGLSEAEATEYATAEALETGRNVLHGRCVECHDLRTVLARPRTAVNWRQTVQRMAAMTTEEHPLTESDQWHVTAYLIALSPRLQQSRRTEREEVLQTKQSQEAIESATTAEVEPTAYDPERAEALFESKCSQCHALELVDQVELTSTEDARALVARMVELGAQGTTEEFRQIIDYLDRNYVESPEE